MNIEAVKNHIKYLREDKYSDEFYVALILYDILELQENDITKEDINKAYEIFDDYNSIYKEDLRDRSKKEIVIEPREKNKQDQEEELSR